MDHMALVHSAFMQNVFFSKYRTYISVLYDYIYMYINFGLVSVVFAFIIFILWIK